MGESWTEGGKFCRLDWTVRTIDAGLDDGTVNDSISTGRDGNFSFPTGVISLTGRDGKVQRGRV